jgi:hypothetical protein
MHQRLMCISPLTRVKCLLRTFRPADSSVSRNARNTSWREPAGSCSHQSSSTRRSQSGWRMPNSLRALRGCVVSFRFVAVSNAAAVLLEEHVNQSIDGLRPFAGGKGRRAAAQQLTSLCSRATRLRRSSLRSRPETAEPRSRRTSALPIACRALGIVLFLPDEFPLELAHHPAQVAPHVLERFLGVG